MKKTDIWEKFWKTYRNISLYYLLFPAICCFSIGLFSYLLDVEPERFDRHALGVVVSCVDKTNRSRGVMQNGGPILNYLIEAEYQVDGVTYTCREHWGSPRQIGSVATITYNSDKPSDSTLNTDPVAGKKRVGNIVVVSGVVLFLCVVPLVVVKIRKSKKRK